VFELEAAARFGHLSEALADTGARREVVGLAREAAEDELRHAALCRQLVVHHGGHVEPSGLPVSAQDLPRPIAPRGLDRRQRLLYEVIALSCVTETLSLALLGRLVERANDDATRRAMQSILRDEVRHSRLGWAHLASEATSGARDIVGAYLPAMLAGTVQPELFSAGPEHPLAEDLGGLGALSRRERRDVFARTLTQVIFPGLECFGVDTARGRRWLGERLEASASCGGPEGCAATGRTTKRAR
jgi:hypothetical protein